LSDNQLEPKNIVFVFGEGGHQAEMECLVKYINIEQCAHLKFIAMTDVKSDIGWAHEKIRLKEVRDKQSKLKGVALISLLLSNFIKSFRILRTNNVTLVVSTGPGKAIATAMAAKLLGVKVLHVESCARFQTKSFTGRLMYFLADEFWVQNESLITLYPKATYVGLL